MSTFKVDKTRKVLQWKKEHEDEFIDLGVAGSEVESLKETVNLMQLDKSREDEAKENELPYYKEYAIEWDAEHRGTRLVVEELERLGLRYPGEATLAELSTILFSDKVNQVTNEAFEKDEFFVGTPDGMPPIEYDFMGVRMPLQKADIDPERRSRQKVNIVMIPPVSNPLKLRIGGEGTAIVGGTIQLSVDPRFLKFISKTTSYNLSKIGGVHPVVNEDRDITFSLARAQVEAYTLENHRAFSDTLNPTIRLKRFRNPSQVSELEKREGELVVPSIVRPGKIYHDTTVDTLPFFVEAKEANNVDALGQAVEPIVYICFPEMVQHIPERDTNVEVYKIGLFYGEIPEIKTRVFEDRLEDRAQMGDSEKVYEKYYANWTVKKLEYQESLANYLPEAVSFMYVDPMAGAKYHSAHPKTNQNYFLKGRTEANMETPVHLILFTKNRIGVEEAFRLMTEEFGVRGWCDRVTYAEGTSGEEFIDLGALNKWDVQEEESQTFFGVGPKVYMYYASATSSTTLTDGTIATSTIYVYNKPFQTFKRELI